MRSHEVRRAHAGAVTFKDVLKTEADWRRVPPALEDVAVYQPVEFFLPTYKAEVVIVAPIPTAVQPGWLECTVNIMLPEVSGRP
jgi:hypothetical protein